MTKFKTPLLPEGNYSVWRPLLPFVGKANKNEYLFLRQLSLINVELEIGINILKLNLDFHLIFSWIHPPWNSVACFASDGENDWILLFAFTFAFLECDWSCLDLGICTGFVLGLFSLPRSLRLEKAAASAGGQPSVAPLSLLRGQISPDSARGRSQWDARARLSVRRAQPMNIRLGRVAPPSPPPRPAPGPCERSVLFSRRFFFFFPFRWNHTTKVVDICPDTN